MIALNNLLDNRNRELERMKNELTRKEIITPVDKYKHPAIIMLEDLVDRAQTVRDRVINTPEC